MSVDFRIVREAGRPDIAWAVIEPFWYELRTPYEPDARLALLTPGQRAVYALWWVRSEVDNGGFEQCFSNSTGFLFPEAVAGAEVLGAEQWAGLLRRARDLFPPPYPRNRCERNQLLAEMSSDHRDAMDRFTDEMYDFEDADATALDAIFGRYIDRHPEEFFVETSS